MGFTLEMVHSHSYLKGPLPETLANETQISLYCPRAILEAFRDTLKGSKLLGTRFFNPYTKQTLEFPKSEKELNAYHLQLLARNEAVNTTGDMKLALYDGLLTQDEVAKIRCLVKATTIAGSVQVDSYGGYGFKKQVLDKGDKAIIIDQSGFQWQNDFRNTGGLFFYPDNAQNTHLPEGYAQWQDLMYPTLMNGSKRPSGSSDNQLQVNWNRVVSGVIDLEALAKGFEIEFRQALEAAVFQGEVELEANDKINFRFLKAGMGFFSAGIAGAKSPELQKLEQARLEGIRQALTYLLSIPAENRNLGKVQRLELPFSALAGSEALISDIGRLTKELGLEWGGVPSQDALMPTPGFVNALTNCGDPHAMIGNEGGYASVDAAIASNAPGVWVLRVGANPQMREVHTTNALLTIADRDEIMAEFNTHPEPISVPVASKVDTALEAPSLPQKQDPDEKIVKATAALVLIGIVLGCIFLGPVGLLIGAAVLVGGFFVKKINDSNRLTKKAENNFKENSKLQNQSHSSSAPAQNASSVVVTSTDKENQNEHPQTMATKESTQNTKKSLNP